MHRLIARVPTIEEYTWLCRAVGWGDGNAPTRRGWMRSLQERTL